MKLLTENNNHVFICGITRSGKTYFAKNAVAQIKRPVLFFNIQNEVLQDNFLEVNESDDKDLIMQHLKNGGKVNFIFSTWCRSNHIQTIIGFLLRELFCAGYTQIAPLYIVIDEAQLLKDSGLNAAIDVATRGLSRGLRLICITQRPALVNKTIYTQAAEHYIFRLQPGEKQYMQNKGIDFDFCQKEWARLGEHSYIFTDGFKTEGRKSI